MHTGRSVLAAVTSIGALAALCGCATEVGSEARAQHSESGSLHGMFAPDPDPPHQGDNTLEITLHDHDGSGFGEAEIEVEPWMPAHGHGSPTAPVVTEVGDGVYDVQIFYPMTGRWELRIELSRADLQDRFVVEQNVR